MLFKDFKSIAIFLLMAGALYQTNANADIRINADGEDECTDSNGNVWLADMGYNTGSTSQSSADIRFEHSKKNKG